MKINMKIFKKYIVKLIEEGYYTLIKETMKKCFIKNKHQNKCKHSMRILEIVGPITHQVVSRLKLAATNSSH